MNHDHIPYPAFPELLPCARAAIDIVRQGQTFERRAELGKHCWIAIGAAQGLILGEPASGGPGATMLSAADGVEAAAMIADLDAILASPADYAAGAHGASTLELLMLLLQVLRVLLGSCC